MPPGLYPAGDAGALAAWCASPALQQVVASPEAQPSEAWPSLCKRAVRMAVGWTHMLAADMCKTESDLEVGAAGLAAALVLCSTAPGTAALLAFRDAAPGEGGPGKTMVTALTGGWCMDGRRLYCKPVHSPIRCMLSLMKFLTTQPACMRVCMPLTGSSTTQ